MIYIDDILIMARSQQIAWDHLYLTLDILEILGFLVNYPKCIHTTNQFSGIFGELQRDEALSHPRKGDNYHQGGHNNIEFSSPSIRPTVGKDDRATQCYHTSGFTSSPTLPTFTTKNQFVLLGGYTNSGPLINEAQLELKWWLQTLHRVNGRAIKPNLPDMTIYTDVSTWGWGARSGEMTIGGAWNNTEIMSRNVPWAKDTHIFLL